MTKRKRYQVEQHTVCDGWTNTWTEEGENGRTVPQTFNSRAEAQAAIEELLVDIRIAVMRRDMAKCYRRVDFRVRLLQSPLCVEA